MATVARALTINLVARLSSASRLKLWVVVAIHEWQFTNCHYTHRIDQCPLNNRQFWQNSRSSPRRSGGWEDRSRILPELSNKSVKFCNELPIWQHNLLIRGFHRLRKTYLFHNPGQGLVFRALKTGLFIEFWLIRSEKMSKNPVFLTTEVAGQCSELLHHLKIAIYIE